MSINWDLVYRGLMGEKYPDPVSLIMEVDKEVFVYPQLKNFDTEEDLKAWVALHDELYLGDGNVCDDYSQEAQYLAVEDGYFLSSELVQQGVCYQTQIFWKDGNGNTTVTNTGTPDERVYHVANMARVEHGKSGRSEYWYCDLNWNFCCKLCELYVGGKY